MERTLYLKTLSVETAYEKYFTELKKNVVLKTEMVDTKKALNRITAKSIFAKCNSPLFNASAMDGICVVSKNTKGATEENPIILKLNEDYKIVDTGDPIKSPFDAVIMAEDVIGIDDNKVKIIKPVPGWQHVRSIGEDIVAGEMILESNHRIKPIDIGALLAGGILQIECYKKLDIGIIPTGTEIIEPNSEPKVGDIFDSNSYMINALIENAKAIGHRYEIIKDDYEKIKEQILNSVSKNDITIINAGSSAGTEDFTVKILEEVGKVLVHGVSIKPGKPVILAIVNEKPVIGLPGYPLSAYLNFNLFVKPVIDLLSGEINDDEESGTVDAVLSKRLVSSLKYREYVRVKLGKVCDKYIAAPLNRGAASQMSMVRADGILIIPKNCEGLEASEICKVKLLKPKSVIDKTLVSIGSQDMLVDYVSDLMSKKYKQYSLSSTHVGSMGGLMALKRNETVIAPTHLLSEKTGIYNVEAILEIFGEGEISIIKGFDRIQGIMVKKGNPLNIKGIEDLVKGKFVNRQRGSGTRVLLDYKLKTLGINPADIDGYDKEVVSHMAVAASVKGDEIDMGLGSNSAANAMGLDFIEVGIEEYDFAIRTKNLNDDKVKAFIDIIKSDELKNILSEIGGYGFSKTGDIINI